MKNLYLIGGGGHCRSCIDVIEKEAQFKIRGILDVEGKIGSSVLNYTVTISDSDLINLVNSNNFFLVTIGHIKSPNIRIDYFRKLKDLGAKLATVVSPLAYVSSYAEISEGTIVMHHALINSNARIGANCILNSKSLVEHDVTVGNHTHISTGALVNGGCEIGEECFIGSNASLKEYMKVPSKTLISAGSFYRG